MDIKAEKKDKMFKMKLKWLKRANKQFGNCGKLLYVNGRCVGYCQYAPAKFLPNACNYCSGPVSRDAVLVSCLFVPSKKYMKLGLGSQLLKRVIVDLKKRGIKAVETFARKDKAANPSGPMEFYIKNGFRILKDDKEFPLMRFDL